MRLQRLAPFSHPVATLLACAWMALSSAIHSSRVMAGDNDAIAIRALVGATWDRPDSKVEADPIVVSGQHALASWTQGERGGRALLKRDGIGWKVLLCSGDPLTQAEWLIEAGVPEGDAQFLAKMLADNEANVPAARRAKFSLFEGTVRGDAPEHRHDAEHKHQY